jgi:Bacterial Ig domain/Lysyl oxidase
MTVALTHAPVHRRLAVALCTVLSLTGLAGLTSSTGAAAASVTPPDMQLNVPTGDISIGTNPSNGHRQLQFTHVTWDAGTGPFEIDPAYNATTGIASFTQAIYNSPSPGVWQFDHSVPLGTNGVFDPPTDYRFPLTSFTLDHVNPDGSVGPVVATSPKTDYCITGDTYVGGVPNTPSQTFIPQDNCADPTKPLGWSVGWGDQYDQTDNGQPIDLTGIPGGTYILQGIVDPEHVLTESNPDNNVVDTKLQITGNTATVLSQTQPTVTPPAVTLTSPANGSTVSGTVMLQASASATAPATVASVQFLLDGQSLGAPRTSAPYTYAWNAGSTSLGTHQLSARVTDSSGFIDTAPVETVSVTAGAGAPVVDQSLNRTGTGTVTTPTFSTAAPGEKLAAFVGSDGPAGSGKQKVTVSGAGLSWRLVKRENGRSGDSEIWTATAASQLGKVKVTSKPAKAGYPQSLTVMSFEDAAGMGASADASRKSGAPSVSLTTTAANSLSFAVGTDWDNAIGRTLGSGQAMISQWVDTMRGDTFWVQGSSRASSADGQRVTLRDTAPTTDQWNMATVEVTPSSSNTVPPTVSITNPVASETVSATVPVAASASGNAPIASVQFFLDGTPLGSPVSTAPYATQWDTTSASNGTHTLSAQATDTSGNVGTSPNVTVTVQNPAPPMTCFVMQADVSVHGHGTVTTPSFHTAAAGETLLAFVGSDGPAKAAGQTVTVSGADLTWTLVQRANGQYGDAEIWQATANKVLPHATVTSTQAHSGYAQSLTVIAMEGANGAGASASASAASGPPKVSLTTTEPTSLVFAVGNDWDNAIARTQPAGWVRLNQWLDKTSGNTDWSQYTNVPVQAAGTQVTVRDKAPATDRWNLAAVELTGDDS